MTDKHESELLAGYHALAERARKRIAEVGEHLSLHELLETTRTAASELQAFSQDEFSRLSYYIKRDLADRGHQDVQRCDQRRPKRWPDPHDRSPRAKGRLWGWSRLERPHQSRLDRSSLC